MNHLPYLLNQFKRQLRCRKRPVQSLEERTAPPPEAVFGDRSAIDVATAIYSWLHGAATIRLLFYFMSYGQVDMVINAWVKRHAFALFDEFGGLPRRFVYLSSNDGECCQISIDSPVFGEIALHAFDVETRNDEELEMHWRVPVNDLERALEDAVVAVKQWWLRKEIVTKCLT